MSYRDAGIAARGGREGDPIFVASFSGKGTVSAYSAVVVFHDIAHRGAPEG